MEEEGADQIGPPGPEVTEPGPPSGPPPGSQPPSPPGGGGNPVLAALARRQRGPQISAPGPGDTGNAMVMMMQAVGMLQQLLPGLPPGTPMHKDVLKAISSLSRHASQGQPTAGVQQTQLLDMLKNVMRNALLQKIMTNQGAQGRQPAPGPAGGNPIQAAAAAPPMPSTPLPGA